VSLCVFRAASSLFCARGFQKNEFDNQEIVLKSLNFVLNVHSYCYTTHAHFVLEERMAESPEKFFHSHNLLAKAKPALKKSLLNYTFAKELTNRNLEKWDGGYYSEKLKQNYLILMTKN
jgi:peptidyl-dipeptidase Dcp